MMRLTQHPVIHEPGKCPYCGSMEVDYGNDNPMCAGEHISYKGHCDCCGKDFREWYRLEFIESVGETVIKGAKDE